MFSNRGRGVQPLARAGTACLYVVLALTSCPCKVSRKRRFFSIAEMLNVEQQPPNLLRTSGQARKRLGTTAESPSRSVCDLRTGLQMSIANC